MCWGCVREYYETEGVEWDWEYPNPLPVPSPEHLPLMRDIWSFYQLDECSTGGPLHITLDDCNVTDSNLEFCRGRLNGVQSNFREGRWVDTQGPPMEGPVAEIGHRILDALSAMNSEAERALIVEFADPYGKGPRTLADVRF